jgi:hypothetical protein
MSVKPVQFDFKLVGAESDGSQDPETAGIGDRCGDVAAVGEGEDRELDPEAFAKLVVHRESS